MTINLFYFGQIAQETNKLNEVLGFDKNTFSLEDLKQELEKLYPSLHQNNYNFAVNQTIKNLDFLIKNNDEVALLPPFAGG